MNADWHRASVQYAMQNVAAVWLMTSLTPSPLMVALVQTATSLPVFLLALPAGALADIVDRRRFLIVSEIAITIVAAVFAASVWLGRATAENLLRYLSEAGVQREAAE